jgi:hypothetical protein
MPGGLSDTPEFDLSLLSKVWITFRASVEVLSVAQDVWWMVLHQRIISMEMFEACGDKACIF